MATRKRITAETPTEEIITSRAKLINLAQMVFELTSNNAIQAFSQFRRNDQLAAVIEAKRQGIWDYGKHIQKTGTGYTYPPAKEALEMLEAAMQGGEEEPAQVEEVTEEPVLTRGQKAALTRKRNKEKREAEARAAADEGEAAAEEAETALRPVEKRPEAPPLPGFGAMLADGLEILTKEIAELHAETRRHTEASAVSIEDLNTVVGVHLEPIHKVLDLIMARQQVIVEYLDPYAELPATWDVEVQPAAEVIEEAEGSFEATITPASKPEKGNGSSSYTKEQLNKMSLKDLQEVATSLGIRDADKKPYKPLLVRTIMRNQPTS